MPRAKLLIRTLAMRCVSYGAIIWIVPVNSDLGIRYYAIVRDMSYTRITFQNLNYTFLHNLVADARTIMNEIGERRAFEAEESLLLNCRRRGLQV